MMPSPLVQKRIAHPLFVAIPRKPHEDRKGAKEREGIDPITVKHRKDAFLCAIALAKPEAVHEGVADKADVIGMLAILEKIAQRVIKGAGPCATKLPLT